MGKGAMTVEAEFFGLLAKVGVPLCGLLVLLLAALPLCLTRPRQECWASLTLPDGTRLPVTRWENTLGRAGASDLRLKSPDIARTHALLLREGRDWWVRDLGGGVRRNGVPVQRIQLAEGDLLTFGRTETVFRREESRETGGEPSLLRALLGQCAVTLCALLLWGVLFPQVGEESREALTFAFFALPTVGWLSLLLTALLGFRGFEPETVALYLTELGLAVCASSDPGALPRQTLLALVGVVLYWVMGFLIRSQGRLRVLRPLAILAALGLLGANLLFAKSLLGARNWLSLGGYSFQPSEFAKLAFVLAGAASLDRLYSRRNLLGFAAFSLFCMAVLALCGDFGTALVYFIGYLVMAFLRSGSFAALILSLAGAGGAALLAITARPYLTARFASWGHAWEAAQDGGYQQVRAMSAVASGGLFGLGAGQGWFRRVFAADTDMVFALVAEELGLVTALVAVALLLCLGLFAARSAIRARGAFPVIAACGTAALLLTQTALNVFGSLDLLPFTGVTLPFVSKGGSSLLTSWGLLAFLKAADARRRASFAVKRRPKDE